jgi:hypothetical protein
MRWCVFESEGHAHKLRESFEVPERCAGLLCDTMEWPIRSPGSRFLERYQPQNVKEVEEYDIRIVVEEQQVSRVVWSAEWYSVRLR